jgi:hypothetical protein
MEITNKPGRSFQLIGLSVLCMSAVLGTAGCGELDPAAEDEAIATTEQAIDANWRPWFALPTQTGGFAGDSAVCDAHTFQGNYVVFGRAATGFGVANRFRMSIVERLAPPTPWASLGSATFNSKPACAVLDGLYDLPQNLWNYQKAIVGRSSAQNTLNRYMIRIVKLPPTSPIMPSTVLGWTQISTDTFASAPAAAVAIGISGGTLIVCGRKSDNRLYCNMNVLFVDNTEMPFNQFNWQGYFQLPAMPTGWTPQGDPAIADTTPWLSRVTITTRATNAGQTRFYQMDWDGTTFGTWNQITTVTSGIGSDPGSSVDIINSWGQTIFYRGTDGKIYQGSGLGTVGWSFSPLNNANNTGFSGAPSAAGSLSGWEGENVVVGKKNSQFQTASPCPNPNAC